MKNYPPTVKSCPSTMKNYPLYDEKLSLHNEKLSLHDEKLSPHNKNLYPRLKNDSFKQSMFLHKTKNSLSSQKVSHRLCNKGDMDKLIISVLFNIDFKDIITRVHFDYVFRIL